MPVNFVYIWTVGSLNSRIQRQGLQSEQLPPLTVEFKNVLSYIFVSYIIINYRYKFTRTNKNMLRMITEYVK